MRGNSRTSADGVRSLVDRGLARGYVTLDEILEVYPEVEEDVPALEKLYARLEEIGIEVGPPSRHRPQPRSKRRAPRRLDIDDTLSLYLREVGRVKLLTAAEEVELSQRMERADVARKDLASAGRGVNRAQRRRLRRVVTDGEAARHHLVQANARLVIAMAKRYVNQGVPFEDLIQEGNLGLMKAADRFDWRRGHKFSTYATWWVRQAITRALADQGRTIRVPVHMSDRIRRLYHTSRRLEQELSRTPSLEELGAEMGLSVPKVRQAMDVAKRPLSLEKPVGEDQDSELGEFIQDDSEPRPEDEAARAMLRDDMEVVLTSLSRREARVLELRYGLIDGRAYTLKEVGEKFGLTRERIRQIENEALARLREPRRADRLADYMS
ncbi:MAG: sigma-70 family RNA polymerase sigma factor [Anaerolineae bacterium]